MKYLFVNSSTKELIISIIEDNEVKYFSTTDSFSDLSINIMPEIDKAFKSASMNIKDIDTIFVTNGPGSFTGIRIGLTVAKVMAWSLKIKVVPISSLELMASGFNGNTLPMIDARRGYIFAGLYDENLDNIIEDQYIEYDKFMDILKEKNIEEYRMVSHDFDCEKPKYDLLKIINKHINDDGVNPHELNPNYLKMTEAEEKLNESR